MVSPGCRIVVSGTGITFAIGLSSKPTSDKSSGIRRPASVAAFDTPSAISSFPAKMAVTRSASSLLAPRYPDSMEKSPSAIQRGSTEIPQLSKASL